ncbi:hypothetical protein ACWD3J_13680 [Streptomyces sp. NPDC002755]
MRILWLLLAILFTCLTIGGILTAFERTDSISLAGDLAISLVLGVAAAGAWRQVRGPVSRQLGEDNDERPWRR